LSTFYNEDDCDVCDTCDFLRDNNCQNYFVAIQLIISELSLTRALPRMNSLM